MSITTNCNEKNEAQLAATSDHFDRTPIAHDDEGFGGKDVAAFAVVGRLGQCPRRHLSGTSLFA